MKATLLDKVSTEALEELLGALNGVMNEMKAAVPENSERYNSEAYVNCLSLNSEVLAVLRHQATFEKVVACETLADVVNRPPIPKRIGQS